MPGKRGGTGSPPARKWDPLKSSATPFTRSGGADIPTPNEKKLIAREQAINKERTRRRNKRLEEQRKRATTWAAPRSTFLPSPETPPEKGGPSRPAFIEPKPLTPQQQRNYNYIQATNRLRLAAGAPLRKWGKEKVPVGPLYGNPTDVLPRRPKTIKELTPNHSISQQLTAVARGFQDVPGDAKAAGKLTLSAVNAIGDALENDLIDIAQGVTDTKVFEGQRPEASGLSETPALRVIAAIGYGAFNTFVRPGNTLNDLSTMAEGLAQLIAMAATGQLDAGQLVDAIKEDYRTRYGKDWKKQAEEHGLFFLFDGIAAANITSRFVLAGRLLQAGEATNPVMAFAKTFKRGRYEITAKTELGDITATKTQFSTPVGRGIQRAARWVSEQAPNAPIVGAVARVARADARSFRQQRVRDLVKWHEQLGLVRNPTTRVPIPGVDKAGRTRFFWATQFGRERGAQALIDLRNHLSEIADQIQMEVHTDPINHQLRDEFIAALETQFGDDFDGGQKIMSLIAIADSRARTWGDLTGNNPSEWWEQGIFGGGLEAVRATGSDFNPKAVMRHLFQRDDMDPIYIGTLQREAQELLNMVEGKRRLHKPGSDPAGPALPPGIETNADVVKLMHSVRTRAMIAKADKTWYKRSARAMLRYVGGDKEKADRFAQVVAIFSPRTPVDINTARAVEFWDDMVASGGKHSPAEDKAIADMIASGAGEDKVKALRTKYAKARKAYNEGYTFNIGSLSESERKTYSFYLSFLYYIDREKFLRVYGNRWDSIPVPLDVWLQQALGWQKVRNPKTGRLELPSPTPAQYDFAEGLIQRIAKQMEWTPDEVMAALWTHFQQGTYELEEWGDFGRAIDMPAPLDLSKLDTSWQGSKVGRTRIYSGQERSNILGAPYGGKNVGHFMPKPKKEKSLTRSIKSLANRAWKRVLANNGFSLDPGTLKPIKFKDGEAAVSWGAYENVIPMSQASEKDILAWWSNPDIPSGEPGAILGGWQYDGNLYLDVSRKFDDLREALAWGREQGQLQIFYMDNGKEKFIDTGLTEAEANAIKARLKYEADPNNNPPPPPPPSSGAAGAPIGIGPGGAPLNSGPIARLLEDIEDADAAGAQIYEHFDTPMLVEAANFALDHGESAGWTLGQFNDLADGLEARILQELDVDNMQDARSVVDGLPDIHPEVKLFNRWEALIRKMVEVANSDPGIERRAGLEAAEAAGADPYPARELTPSQRWAQEHRQMIQELARDVWSVFSDEEIKGLIAERGSNKGLDRQIYNSMRAQGLIDEAGNVVRASDTFPEEWGGPKTMEQRGEGGVIRGAVEFGPDDTKIVHIFRSANASTFLHEFIGHSIPFELARWAPDDLKVLEDWVGAEIANWVERDYEKVARAFEAYVRRGNAPNRALDGAFRTLANLLRELYASIRELLGDDRISPAVRELFDKYLVGSKRHGRVLNPQDARTLKQLREMIRELDEAAEWEPNERFEQALDAAQALNALSREIIDDVFEFTEDLAFNREMLLELLIYGPDDAVPGGFMPHRSQGAVRQALRGGGGSTDVNRRINIEVDPSGPRINQLNELDLLHTGRIAADPKLLDKHVRHLLALAFQSNLRKHLYDLGTDVVTEAPVSLDDVVLIMPKAKHIPEWWNEFTKGDVEKAMMEYAKEAIIDGSEIKLDDLQSLLRVYPDIKQVPRKYVETLMMNLYGYKKGFRQVGKTAQVFDLASMIAKTGILYANAPGYHVANLFGNIIFLGMGPGLEGLVNLFTRTGRLWKKDRQLFLRISAEMGHGMAGAIDQTIPGTGRVGVAQQAIRKFMDASSGVVDNWPRVAAWQYHARKLGYKTYDDYVRLLDSGSEDLKTIRDAALDDMVDFDALTPWERMWFARFVFIWPWLRGAAKWAVSYPVREPTGAVVVGQATKAAHDEQERYRKENNIFLPSWLGGALVYDADGKTARTLNFQSFSPFGPIRDLGLTVAAMRGPLPKSRSLFEMLTPIVQNAYALSRGENQYGRNLGYGGAAAEAGFSLLPSWARSVVAPEKSSDVYTDQSTLGGIKRGARLFPYDIDLQQAKKSYESEQPGEAKPQYNDPNAQVRDWVNKHKAAADAMGLDAIPAEVLRGKQRYFHFLVARRMLSDELGINVSKLGVQREVAIKLSILENVQGDIENGPELVRQAKEAFEQLRGNEDGLKRMESALDKVLLISAAERFEYYANQVED